LNCSIARTTPVQCTLSPPTQANQGPLTGTAHTAGRASFPPLPPPLPSRCLTRAKWSSAGRKLAPLPRSCLLFMERSWLSQLLQSGGSLRPMGGRHPSQGLRAEVQPSSHMALWSYPVGGRQSHRRLGSALGTARKDLPTETKRFEITFPNAARGLTLAN
jgi:hypothetical protein